MKKTTQIFLILLTLNGCKGQNENKQKVTINNKNMEHFNIDKYKDWEIDSEYTSVLDTVYKKGNKRVTVGYGGEEDVQVEESDNTPYKTYKNFSLKTKSLLYVGKSFYNVNLGIWSYYNEDGSLIEERNEDLGYKLSVEEMIKIVKQDYNIDLMDTSKRFNVSRNDVPKPQYQIRIPLGETTSRNIGIDASTGKTIYDDKSDTDDKFKKNKETSKKMSYQEYREKGIRVHQIYEDVCYTEDEWNEFLKTKSWWWRKLNT